MIPWRYKYILSNDNIFLGISQTQTLRQKVECKSFILGDEGEPQEEWGSEVEGGEETHSPAFRDVIKDSTFRPASFSLPAFHKRQRTSVQLKET